MTNKPGTRSADLQTAVPQVFSVPVVRCLAPNRSKTDPASQDCRLQIGDTADYKSALRPRGVVSLSWHRDCRALGAAMFSAFFFMNAQSAELTNSTSLRDEWVDADTGHRVVRLSRLPGSSESFYFHQNA